MTDLVNTTLGSCHLLKLLSKGGMGEIYLANQPLLNRTVAVKVIRTDHNQQASFVQRFEHEARALAALEHPHIVPLYEYGYQQEIAYFVMPYISGGTLRERIKQGSLSLVEIMHLLEQIAAALDYAHKQAIIHRDIKPANVLLRDDSWPLLADFGVAKLAANATQSTHSHVGTPLYMAPEQWLGQGVSKQTDIYALGVMVYELLTGAPPFKGNEWGNIMHQHLEGVPASICVHNPTVPKALEPVIYQAMAKEPSQRFSSAAQFAIAAKQAIEARNTAPAESSTNLPPSPIFQGIPPDWRADPFTVPAAFSPPHTRQVWSPLVRKEGTTELSPTASRPDTIDSAISAHATIYMNQQVSSHTWLKTPIMMAEWKNHPGAIDSMALLWNNTQVISSTPNTILLWKVGIPHSIAQMTGHTRPIWALITTSDDRFLISGSWDRSIRIWDIAQQRLKRTLMGHSDIVFALALAMNDRMLISSSRDGTLRFWELPSGRQLRIIRHPGGPVWSLLALPSHEMIVAGAENGMVGLWNLKNGQAIWNRSLGDVGQVQKILILDPEQLLCITQKRELAILEVSTGEILQVLKHPSPPLNNAIALDAKVIYADASGMLYLWNLKDTQQRFIVRAHERRISTMVIQPSSGIVVTSSEDRSFKLWRFLEVDQLQTQK